MQQGSRPRQVTIIHAKRSCQQICKNNIYSRCLTESEQDRTSFKLPL